MSHLCLDYLEHVFIYLHWINLSRISVGIYNGIFLSSMDYKSIYTYKVYIPIQRDISALVHIRFVPSLVDSHRTGYLFILLIHLRICLMLLHTFFFLIELHYLDLRYSTRWLFSVYTASLSGWLKALEYVTFLEYKENRLL